MERMKHLLYWCYGASLAGVKKHPQQVMKDLGITYKHSTPQSMADQWQFWNCGNIPDELPEFIEELKVMVPVPEICVARGTSDCVSSGNMVNTPKPMIS